MGGLQNGLMQRSKNVEGHSVVTFKKTHQDTVFKIWQYLKEKEIKAYPEYELELLIRHGNFISPVIIHGLPSTYELPKFLEDRILKGTFLGADLAYKLQVDYNSNLKLISPSHINTLLGDIPRYVTTSVGDILYTNVPEIDVAHGWTRLSLVQNLTRERNLNRIRIYQHIDDWSLLESQLNQKFGLAIQIKTWEQLHSSLVWALNLENTVMLSLFIGMSFLVAISITSGFMIFFDKIKVDLISFWILGSSFNRLRKMSKLFLHFLSASTCLLGIGFSLVVLLILKNYSGDIMPVVFVERGIPIHLSWSSIIVAFVIPYSIAIIFSHFALSVLSKEEATDQSGFVQYLRSIG